MGKSPRLLTHPYPPDRSAGTGTSNRPQSHSDRQKEQAKTIQDLKKGMVDILIGTHRVLSKDVQFKDLGLLMIDEEQRFGVTDNRCAKTWMC